MSYFNSIANSINYLNSLVNQTMFKNSLANSTGQTSSQTAQIPPELASALSNLTGLLNSTKSGTTSSATVNESSVAYTVDKLVEAGASMDVVTDLLDALNGETGDILYTRTGSNDPNITLQNMTGIKGADLQNFLSQATRIAQKNQDINKYLQTATVVAEKGDYDDFRRFMSVTDTVMYKSQSLDKYYDFTKDILNKRHYDMESNVFSVQTMLSYGTDLDTAISIMGNMENTGLDGRNNMVDLNRVIIDAKNKQLFLPHLLNEMEKSGDTRGFMDAYMAVNGMQTTEPDFTKFDKIQRIDGEDMVITQGESAALFAQAISSRDGLLPESVLYWSSMQTGAMSNGSSYLDLSELGPGTYDIWVKIGSYAGGTDTAKKRVIVLPNEDVIVDGGGNPPVEEPPPVDETPQQIPHGISHVIYNLADGRTLKLDEYGGDIKDPADPSQYIDDLEARFGVEITGYTIKAATKHYDESGNQVENIPNQADLEITMAQLKAPAPVEETPPAEEPEPVSDPVTIPAQGKLRITVEKGSAGLDSDLYLQMNGENTLVTAKAQTNTDFTLEKTYNEGDQLDFFIRTHAESWGLGTYEHGTNTELSPSGKPYYQKEQLDDNSWRIRFEDLPEQRADWDYNDVVIKVELIPAEAASTVAPAENKSAQVVQDAPKVNENKPAQAAAATAPAQQVQATPETKPVEASKQVGPAEFVPPVKEPSDLAKMQRIYDLFKHKVTATEVYDYLDSKVGKDNIINFLNNNGQQLLAKKYEDRDVQAFDLILAMGIDSQFYNKSCAYFRSCVSKDEAQDYFLSKALTMKEAQEALWLLGYRDYQERVETSLEEADKAKAKKEKNNNGLGDTKDADNAVKFQDASNPGQSKFNTESVTQPSSKPDEKSEEPSGPALNSNPPANAKSLASIAAVKLQGFLNKAEKGEAIDEKEFKRTTGTYLDKLFDKDDATYESFKESVTAKSQADLDTSFVLSSFMDILAQAYGSVNADKK